MRSRKRNVGRIRLSVQPWDRSFFFTVLLLTVLGLIMLLSASFPTAMARRGDALFYFKRQTAFAGIGIVAMILISYMDYEMLRTIGRPLLIISIVLLIAVLEPHLGIMRNNARRWLRIFSVEFQPSEIAKLAVIVDFSASISVKKNRMATVRNGVVPYFGVIAIMFLLLWKEPHLSGAILICAVGAILVFIGGVRLRWVAAVLLVIAGGAALLLNGAVSYGQSRIAMWKDPFIDAKGAGYQLSQSLIAIGYGGMFGLGFGKSRQKFLFLPEVQNDFIFSIIAEEMGLFGAVLILLLFALFVMQGYQIALRAKDRFGTLLCVGIISQVALQTFLNIAVVTGAIPTTGVSLPFFSYGGTALMMQLFEMGIVLSVSRQSKSEAVRPSNASSRLRQPKKQQSPEPNEPR